MPASGPNSGPDDHRADDQDRRVLVDADRREQAGDDHEREVDAGQLDVLARARLHLLPDDRVGGRALGVLDRPLGVLGDLRVDRLDRDRALLVDAELREVGDHDARVLAGDVGEDHVALRAPGDALEQDDVADRGRAPRAARGRRSDRSGGRDDPEVDHGAERTRGAVRPRGRVGSAGEELLPGRDGRVGEVREQAVDAEGEEQLVLRLRVAVVVGGEPARLVAERPRVDVQPALVGAADQRGRDRVLAVALVDRRRRRSRRRPRRRRWCRCRSSGRCTASRARRCRRTGRSRPGRRSWRSSRTCGE